MSRPITPEEMKSYVDATWEKCQSEAWEKPTTREEILSMAREAGFYDGEIGRAEDAFQRFAALVAAHVRETDAKLKEKNT